MGPAGRAASPGFVGVGQVADRLSRFAVDRFKTSVGHGLRFLLSGDDQLIGTHLKAEEFFGGGDLLPVSQAGSEPQAREADGESDQNESESDGGAGFHGIFLKRDSRLNRGG